MSTSPTNRAFSQLPAASHHVPLASTERFANELCQAVFDADGISVVTGPPGIGKTHLAEVVAARLRDPDANSHPSSAGLADEGGTNDDDAAKLTNPDDSTDFEAGQERDSALTVVVLQASGMTTRRSMLQAILHALHEPYASLSEQEARLGLLDAGRKCVEQERPIAIFLDEADHASSRLLEDLRGLTNFVHRDRALFRVMLVGETDFEERLGTSELEAVNHRIVCQVNLGTLSKQESADLIAGRLRHVGEEASELLSDVAVEEICEIAAGVPRAINMLAARTLELAAGDEDHSANEEGGAPPASADFDSVDGENDTESSAGDHQATREHVLRALDELEGLSISWRRPLMMPDDSYWSEKRRSDELPPLEPISGAVLEVGAGSGDETGEGYDDAIPTPLRRMHEVLGIQDGDANSSLADIAASILGGTPVPAAELDEADGRAETDPDTAAATEEQGEIASDDVRVTPHVPALDDTAFRDVLPAPDLAQADAGDPAFGDDASTDPTPDDSTGITASLGDAEEVMGPDGPASRVEVAEFVDPLASPPEDEDVQATEWDGRDALIEAVDSSQDSAEDVALSDDVLETSIPHGEAGDAHSEADGSARETDEARRDRSRTATEFVDAVLPLVSDDDPDPADVQRVQDLLSERAPEVGADSRSGDEASLGREALDLAAEVRQQLGTHEDASSSHDRYELDEAPTFAFDEPDRSGALADDYAGEPLSSSSFELPIDSSDGQAIDADEADSVVGVVSEDRAIELTVAGGIRKPRRLEGLFTRLRQTRGASVVHAAEQNPTSDS